MAQLFIHGSGDIELDNWFGLGTRDKNMPKSLKEGKFIYSLTYVINLRQRYRASIKVLKKTGDNIELDILLRLWTKIYRV